MLLARLGLCVYLLALAFAAAATVDDASNRAHDFTAVSISIAPDAVDELLADDDSFDGDDDDCGVDGEDDAVPVERVTLPAPARLAQPVAAFFGAPRPSQASDDLFRPPRAFASV
jgi:hypothetical protein